MPYTLPFPDLTDETVPAAHAIALTGDRIIASFFHTTAPAPVLPPVAANDPAAGAQASNCTRQQKRQHAGSAAAATCEALEGAVRQQHGALAGASHLAAIMRLEAPSRATLQGVYDLFEACSVLLADEVIRHAPAYAAPALANASLPEVRVNPKFR